MSVKILNLLIGERKIRIKKEDRLTVLNMARENKIRIFSEKNTGEFTEYKLISREAKFLSFLCEDAEIEYELSALLGVNGFLYRYRKRYGILLGIFVLLLTTFMSQYYIWDFEIVGNDKISDDEILSGLSELGCTYGTYIPSLDFEMLANDFLLKSDDISWIAVNMKSSLAVVEVLERDKAQEMNPKLEDGVYANLVSSDDAEIVLPMITHGQNEVSIGSVVRKGELLASGVMTVKDSSVRFEYASGKVLGKVYREILTEIPYETERKVYSGEKTVRKNVKIFGKSKNLFINSSINYAKYDKIEDDKHLCFFNNISVPIWIKTTAYAEYRYEPYKMSEKEAEALARTEHQEEIDVLLNEGEIVSVETVSEVGNDAFRIVSKIYLVKNIAVLSEFKLTE